MTRTAQPPPVRHAGVPAVPALRAGDNRTRAEFIRRYEEEPPDTGAEVMDGVVYMPPPVSYEVHSSPVFDLVSALGNSKLSTPGLVGGRDGSLVLDLVNLPQPDTYSTVATALGGTTTVNADRFVEGPPKLIVELANTSADYDLHQKMNAYRRNGVPRP